MPHARMSQSVNRVGLPFGLADLMPDHTADCGAAYGSQGTAAGKGRAGYAADTGAYSCVFLLLGHAATARQACQYQRAKRSLFDSSHFGLLENVDESEEQMPLDHVIKPFFT